jgi:hypothetical protein
MGEAVRQLGRPDCTEYKKKIAMAIAMGHGAKMIFRPLGGPMQTVASMYGYGHRGDAAERYAHDHWEEYLLSAELAVSVLKEPTVMMLAAADSGPRSVLPGQPILLEAWQAMLAEAVR